MDTTTQAPSDAENLFAKANGMTVQQYRQFLADQDDEL